VLAGAIATEDFQSVLRWGSQVLKPHCVVEPFQFPPGNWVQLGRAEASSNASVATVENIFGAAVAERLDHDTNPMYTQLYRLSIYMSSAADWRVPDKLSPGTD